MSHGPDAASAGPSHPLLGRSGLKGRVVVPCHLQSLAVAVLRRARQRFASLSPRQTPRQTPRLPAAGTMRLYLKGVCVAPLWTHPNKELGCFLSTDWPQVPGNSQRLARNPVSVLLTAEERPPISRREESVD